MSEIEDIGSYDAIVIGSGMSGLMAGSSLLKKGYSVLILEKHAIPGGYTTNFERKGFRFDASTHVVNRGTEFVMPWELGEYVETLATQFPHEEEGIRGYYGKFGPMAATLIASIGADRDAAPPGDVAAAAEEYASLTGKKASDVLSEYVSDPRVVELMTAISCGFTGTPYRELEATTCIMCDLFYRVDGGDAYYPKGGSGHMSGVVADLFRERGGTLLLRRGVTEVVFSGGQAKGIVARKPKGGYISAQGRCVIAASDLTALVNQLCPEGALPAEYVKSVGAGRRARAHPPSAKPREPQTTRSCPTPMPPSTATSIRAAVRRERVWSPAWFWPDRSSSSAPSTPVESGARRTRS